MGTNYDVAVTSRLEAELKQLDIEPVFSENAIKILEKRYLKKDDDGKVIETPKDMLARVAANIAYADILYGASYDQVYDFAKTIYTIMSNLELLPNSPALRGAGRETQQLSACFVLPVEDSRKSIFSTLMDAVDIQAFGGGTGFNFSHLRPRGSKVESTGGEASGPISFMQIYDIAVGKVIAQGGVRQGANMGILSYNHPDVLKFIDAKLDGKTLTNFNISVGVTEEFMEMAEEGLEYDLIDPHTKKAVSRTNARDVLDRIAQNAWATGDPGLIFLDRINRANPTPHIGAIESTNPCITGDTPVAVADGRGSVPIKQLADEGKDVPVYCRDRDSGIAIRMMRNPRLTGKSKRIVRVNLDDGNFVRVTENHKFILNDGTVKQAAELVEGDSLSIMQKMNARLEEVFTSSNSRSQEYSWLRTTNHTGWLLEQGIIAESHVGRKLRIGEIVHQRNYRLVLNQISFCVYFGVLKLASALKAQASLRTPNLRNLFGQALVPWQGSFLYHPHPDLPPSRGKGTEYSPQDHTGIFEAGFAQRARRKLAECQAKTDLRCFLENNYIMVEKVCEGCEAPFVVSWSYREISYHSRECYWAFHNSNKEIRDKIRISANKVYEEKMKGIKGRQVECYNDLKEDLGRVPWLKEFERKCKETGLSYRFGTKHGFDSYKSLKEAATPVNHKVVSVEFDGYEDVYNGTVDEFHSFYIGGFYSEENEKTIQSWIVNKQCGEVPLIAYEACTLASINLTRMLREKDGKYVIDYEKLAYTVKNGVHFLDNVIDMNKYPLEKIEEMTKGNRKIGLGVMGWADVLVTMGISYNSDSALELAEEAMEFINTNAKAASVELARTRGVFPNFKNSIHDTGREEDMVRNASWTTIAPTGTLSILADCSSGIEPLFMIVYRRGSIYDAEGKPTVELLMENDMFKRVAIEREFYSKELAMKIAETGSLQHIDEIPDDVKEVFVTAHDISYEWHLRMQSAFQKYVTNAVSKTINFPKDATVDDVKKSYQLAYKLGNIKGITVYRDGCKEYQVLSSAKEAKPAALEDIVEKLKAPRPRKIAGTTDRIETPVGKLFMTINRANGKLYEVFLNIGKAGADVTADAEGYGRLLSMIFKAGIPPEMVIDQLRGIGGSGSIGFGKQRVRSLPDAIARVLEMQIEDNPSESYGNTNNTNHIPKMSGDMCPECGNMLVFEEGCSKCRNCGYSRC